MKRTRGTAKPVGPDNGKIVFMLSTIFLNSLGESDEKCC